MAVEGKKDDRPVNKVIFWQENDRASLYAK